MTMLKKTASFLTAALLLLTLICVPALAEEAPQPEGGKKFGTCWAMMGGLVEIVYEEEGYRVLVDLYNQADRTGTQWEYSCYYSEEKDALESISSRKTGYTMDLDTLERAFGESEYEGIDEESSVSVFSLSADGALLWNDGHEDMGRDLQFTDIGRFEGVWRNDAEDVYTEFHWQGLLDEEQFCYNVFIGRGQEDCHLAGWYNPETGRLECYDIEKTPIGTAEDLFAALDAGKPLDAVFSDLGNGRMIYSADVEIELEYDILGPES